jgi:hypothetical protein
MPLTEDEKVRIRDHLAFLNVAPSFTFVLGTPAAVETQFIIEGSMVRVLEAAIPLLREKLCWCDSTRHQMLEAQKDVFVKRVGDIELDPKEGMKILRQNYATWVGELANLLGVYRNPFDKREDGGLNVPVLG